MSAIVILLIAIVVFVIAYLTYGRWLAKQWGVDPSRKTPAHTMTDGVDYVPTKAPVLLGHHFASIAGAGPINGPIQAAVFGWVPVLLWVVIGGIFFGGVQDFSSLFASIRNKGQSIGEIINQTMGRTGKRLFICFAFLTLILVVAAFASIVASTFNGFTADGALNMRGGQVAMSSTLFMVLAIAFGFLVYRRNAPLGISSIIGVILLAVCIWVGLSVPLYLPLTLWLVILGVYIFIASVTPVWILLQPRDYLNSFLLYGMMLAAVVGIFVANPSMNLPAFTGAVVNGQPIFPILFITVACGAISGFHSLVGSGTTAKQLNTENDARVIGYGGMLIECLLAVVALIAVSALYTGGKMPEGTPAVVLATGIASFLATIGIPTDIMQTIITLAVSAFALTSLDTATRLARYLFQEFFTEKGEDLKTIKGPRKFFTNMYVSTLITVVLGMALAVGGYQNIWPLFGAANQLLAALALLAVALWLGAIGRNNKMFYIPMLFMLVATLSALVIGVIGNLNKLAAGNPAFPQIIQIIFGVLLFALAVVLAIKGIQMLFDKSKKISTDTPASV